MHEVRETPDQNIFGFTLSGTLTEDDYEALTPFIVDKLERFTTVRILFELDDVEDWEPESLWDDWTFDVRHARNVDKVAVVGDDPWDPWLKKLELLFPSAETAFYEEEDTEAAWDWLRGEMNVPGIGPGSVPEPAAGAQDQEEEEPA